MSADDSLRSVIRFYAKPPRPADATVPARQPAPSPAPARQDESALKVCGECHDTGLAGLCPHCTRCSTCCQCCTCCMKAARDICPTCDGTGDGEHEGYTICGDCNGEGFVSPAPSPAPARREEAATCSMRPNAEWRCVREAGHEGSASVWFGKHLMARVGSDIPTHRWDGHDRPYPIEGAAEPASPIPEAPACGTCGGLDGQHIYRSCKPPAPAETPAAVEATERAARLIEATNGDVPAAIAAAYREGAEAMRERAMKACDRIAFDADQEAARLARDCDPVSSERANGRRIGGKRCEAAIAALKVEDINDDK